MQAHPLTAKVPPISKADYAALREGIRTKGQILPIVTRDGLLWDGRNRQSICEELNITPRYEEYTGSLTAAEYILQANLRRNISDDQRDAMIVAFAREVLPQMYEEAREAKKNGQVRGAAAPKKACDSIASQASRDCSGQTQKRFRQLVGHARKADQATAVIKHEDLAAKVEKGELSLRAAAEQASTRRKTAKQPKPTGEEIALLERIKQPSIFPEGVALPPEGDPLRWCIDELRKHQADIHKMGDTNLWEKIRQHTNALVRKKHLGPELIAWVEDIVSRHNKQTILLSLKARRNPKPERPFKEPKATKPKSFEYYFDLYWTQEEKLLDKFPVKYFKRLIRQWPKDAREFLRQRLASVSTPSTDLPHGQNGAGNSQSVVTSKDEAPATSARKEKSHGKEKCGKST